MIFETRDRRSACYWKCPVYTMKLYRDGRVEYQARSHLPQIGDFAKATSASGATVDSDYGSVGPIDLWAIQELIDGIREQTEWKAVAKDSSYQMTDNEHR